MTDNTQAQAQPQQQVAFPVPKSLWQEAVDFLGTLPYITIGAFRTEAKKGLELVEDAEGYIGVPADFFNAMTNTIAQHPAAAVEELMGKFSAHVAKITALFQAQAEQAQRASQAAQAAAQAAADAQNPAIVTDVTAVTTTAETPAPETETPVQAPAETAAPVADTTETPAADTAAPAPAAAA